MQHIFETIRQYHMIEHGMRVIAGVSGGADSVCLLLALNEYRRATEFELLAVHVEHGLRGQESLGDAQFTKQLCERLGVPCRIVTAQVKERAQAEGLSLEEAGRSERYRIFEKVSEEWGADRIAVAHNRNDQAETVLWNLVRGSGVKGLGGIRPVRDRIIRPLLFTERAEIERILCQAGISWRTDRTNLEREYTRNRIRLSILPQMEQELNAQSVLHIAQAAGRLQKLQDYLERQTGRAAEKCLFADGERRGVRMILEPFLEQEELIQEELLKRALALCRGGDGLKNIGSVHLQMLLELAQMDCGKECHLPGQIKAVRENGILRFKQMRTENQMMEQMSEKMSEQAELRPLDLTCGGSGRFGALRITAEILDNSPEVQKQIMDENKYTKWLSYDTIKSNVLFRTRLPGDYLIVNRQGGRRKLKDYFIDSKVPRSKRDQVCLAADGSHILWAVGGRISEAAKVMPETKRVIKIQIEEEES